MKLRNKKTGQEGNFIINKDHFECVDLDYVPEYRNLAELNAEWEDYEEPKGIRSTSASYGDKRITVEFSTREETVEAYEKLRAWKRLKDKGFCFNGWNWKSQCIDYNLDYRELTDNQIEEADKDLDLLFGGEE